MNRIQFKILLKVVWATRWVNGRTEQLHGKWSWLSSDISIFIQWFPRLKYFKPHTHDTLPLRTMYQIRVQQLNWLLSYNTLYIFEKCRFAGVAMVRFCQYSIQNILQIRKCISSFLNILKFSFEQTDERTFGNQFIRSS